MPRKKTTPRKKTRRARPAANGHATKVDVMDRERRVSELMEIGYGPMQAARKLAEECEIGVEMAHQYVARVRNQWADEEKADRPQRRAAMLKLLETTVVRALAESDHKAVVSAVREMARITGLDVKTVVGGNASPEMMTVIDALILTPVERRKRLAELGAADAPVVNVLAEARPTDGDDP